MRKDSERLDHLSELLQALPTKNMPKTLGDLDGYVTGIVACPEMIPPSEWLPHAWGGGSEAHFADQEVAEQTISAIMTHYNLVTEAMTGSLWITPIYEVDPNSGETVWEPWVDGFIRAMDLRPDAWEGLLDRGDNETQASLIFLMALQDINIGISKLSNEEIEEIDQEAPNLIPNCVATILQQSRPDLAGMPAANLPSMPHNAAARPERNDPCLCGSGRKYKQCCGRN